MDKLREAFAIYKGRRILVTGNTGFKGSWLSFWLHLLGADVYGFSRDVPTSPSHFELLRLHELSNHRFGDLRDTSAVDSLVREVEPEIVFHLAAQATVRQSYLDPKETFDTNVGGAVNLLEALRKCPSLRSLVFITSDKCYLNLETRRGYSEDDRLGGVDPYSCSKAAAEHVLAAYRNAYFSHNQSIGAASTRAGNVVGGGDWAPDRIIPDCVRSLSNGGVVRIRSPRATRPWQHVLEPLSGYLMLGAQLLEKPSEFSGAWNFGPHESASHSVEDVVRKAINVWGSGTYDVEPVDNQLHESTLLHLNAARAESRLGWKTRWNFDSTMTHTVGWYKALAHGADARTLTTEHINTYLASTP